MKRLNLSDWLEYQQGLNSKEIDLNLTRVEEVYNALNITLPKDNIFLVGGTNGKGTTVALLEDILIQKDLKTGVYTSPHLINYNERVCVDKNPLSDKELVNSFEQIEQFRGTVPLTYFEFGTLAAFHLLAMHECDAWIIEVGLGGRLDATNIIQSDVSIITNIDLDHQEFLGDSIEEIAYEKAGIAKSNKPMIYGDTVAVPIIEKQANLVDAKLVVRDREFSIQKEANQFSWAGVEHTIKAIKIPEHWAQGEINNLATSLAAIESYNSSLLPTTEMLNNILKDFFIPGRFELIKSGTNWVLDVAHNPAAAKNFRERLSTLNIKQNNTMIFSMMKDKNLDLFINVFKDIISDWIVCKMNTERSYTTLELEKKLAGLGVDNIKVMESTEEAFKYVENLEPISDNIIVSGSFELVGPAKQYLSEKR
jgi:dihydrofolate synthase/folylpolyglutamate synthase